MNAVDQVQLLRRQFLWLMAHPDGPATTELMGLPPVGDEVTEHMQAECFRNIAHVLSNQDLADTLAVCGMAQTELVRLYGLVPEDEVDTVQGYHTAALVAAVALLYSHGLIRFTAHEEGTHDGQ